ncbi:MAG: PC4/YdbC family ssDNA-binding protein [Clostridia bacterium]|nr:PC4/YdbC family ssDNA-binding protein [Clostridia bacterium]
MSDLKFSIVRNFGVIGEGKEGWRKEVNLVSWNDRKPKLDIREWDENHVKMKKGITLNAYEMNELKSILKELDAQSMEAVS